MTSRVQFVLTAHQRSEQRHRTQDINTYACIDCHLSLLIELMQDDQEKQLLTVIISDVYDLSCPCQVQMYYKAIQFILLRSQSLLKLFNPGFSRKYFMHF